MEHSEIRVLLEKITPGEWKYSDDGHYVWETNTGLYVAKSVTKNDAAFIAASPAIIRQLLDDVEKLTAENENRPKRVCLCGSTNFTEAFQKAQLDETLAGRMVLTIGCDMKSDNELFKNKTEYELAEIKRNLDELHLAKIDLANEVLILNVGGYIGESTRRELEYAKKHGKKIRWLEEVMHE
jgi:hypothetical protein